MNSRERKIQLAAWATIALTIIWFVVRAIPRGPRLSDRSSMVADARTWYLAYPGYFWETDKTLLAVAAAGVRFSRVDLGRHSQTPLNSLSSRITKTSVSTSNWRISPDGKWLLVDHARAHRVSAVSIEGNKEISWPISPRSSTYMHWMPNGTDWVELRPTGQGAYIPVIHSLSGQFRTGRTIVGPCFFPISTTADGRLVDVERYMDHLNIIQYDLTERKALPLTSSVAFPPGESMIETEASHRGDRIAFLMQGPSRVPPLGFLRYLIPSLRQSGSAQTLWLANSDGSGLHKLGDERNKTVAGVQWSPDVSKLSYFIDDKLYTTPAK